MQQNISDGLASVESQALLPIRPVPTLRYALNNKAFVYFEVERGGVYVPEDFGGEGHGICCLMNKD